jgi:hypothetical protein
MFFERNGANSFSVETVVAKMAAGDSELRPRTIFVTTIKIRARCSRREFRRRRPLQPKVIKSAFP